ncbi:hypothetical protein CSOJ01_08454 [Colletotrichum sojae]|uniref:Uncharacterized protein n=1 Tax=Colletotrichum sojae TaxID=2175907 RepID=A0A8H6MSZ5_9PEZI|nr:hypothetical protein CSOJ01_08454 [Colletotrichum sojae]
MRPWVGIAINNHRPGGAALRRAFILLEELIKDEAIDTYRALFFDIPYGVPEAALDMYFGHLSRLLSIKRSGEPIARIATLAERLSGENHGHLFWAIGRMHDIAADLYDGILVKDDLNSLEARFQALTLRGHCGVTLAQGHTEFLARYDAVVNETASSFGPFSSEVLAVEQRQVSVAMELSVEPHVQYDLGERHYGRLVAAHQSEPFEIWSATSLYQFCWVTWILQDIEYVTQTDPGSWRLEQAIHAFPYALQKAGLEEESGDGRSSSGLSITPGTTAGFKPKSRVCQNEPATNYHGTV